jgi:hypothetical protein
VYAGEVADLLPRAEPAGTSTQALADDVMESVKSSDEHAPSS